MNCTKLLTNEGVIDLWQEELRTMPKRYKRGKAFPISFSFVLVDAVTLPLATDMISSSVRTILLTLASLAVVASAAPSLLLEVTGPASVSDVENLKILTTITNTGEETLKVLDDPRGALSQMPTDTFVITDGKGVRPAFKILVPGQSLEVEHNLGAAYNFTFSGSGAYDIRASNLFYIVDHDGTVSTVYAEHLSAHKAHVSGKLAVARPDLSKRATYNGCSVARQDILTSAAKAAQTYTSSALSYLTSHTSTSSRYTTWFGTYIAVSAISNNTLSSFTYDCTCTKSNVYAYVYPNVFGRIYLCGAFWNAPFTGTDSQAGTIVHESSHFDANGGTRDYAYGKSACKSLAISSPETAVKNADSHDLSILAWNINGHLALKIARKRFVDLIVANDICIFQETFLSPRQEECLVLPKGYHALCTSRPLRSRGRLPGGGVAAIIKDDVAYDVCDLVLDLHSFVLIGTYLLPAGSNWRKWTKIDPARRLAECVTFCSNSEDKPVLLLGDLNARTGSLQAEHSELQHCSNDIVSNARGKWLIELCNTNSLHILNGTAKEDSASGSWTSFQPAGQSVIDYAVGATALLNSVLLMRAERLSSSDDHACLYITIDGGSVQPIEDTSPTVPSSNLLPSPSSWSAVDKQLHALLNNPVSDCDAILKLYGPAYFHSNPTNIWVASVEVQKGVVGVACHWRDGKSESFICRGSIALGVLAGISRALLHSPPNRPLWIFTSSDETIRTLAYRAGRLAWEGWCCKYADSIRFVVDLIISRSASVDLKTIRLRRLEPNCAWSQAVNIASSAHLFAHDVSFPPNDDSDRLDWKHPTDIPPITNRPKVLANIPEDPIQETPTRLDLLPLHAPTLRDVDRTSESHRGRAESRDLMWENLRELLACESIADFWALFKRWNDPKPTQPKIRLLTLKENFAARMNPPSSLPPSFDASLFARHELTMKAVPIHTIDISPNLHFSRPFATVEVDWAKTHIRKRGLHKAKGIDGVDYSQIFGVESADWADFFNLCISEFDAPGNWLTTLLAAFLKRGKDPSDPDSYRLIGWECGILKMMMLMNARRLRDWMNEMNILPPSQNGFREGYRTTNCAFILRCAVDRARAEGKSLHVAFVDLKNAFPTTNLSTLWLNFYNKGAKGPIIDWMRMLYSRMQYAVVTGAEPGFCSEPFRSLWGILAGDTASPDLFNIMMSDFNPPAPRHGIFIDGDSIYHLEQADDILLMATELPCLQDLVHYTEDWTGVNSFIISSTKSLGVVFGPLPQSLSNLSIGDDNLIFTDCFKYVGITFSSTERCIFAQHYRNKASSALNTAYNIMGSEVYMSTVDADLTFGCETIIDIDLSLLALLENVQVEFFRLLLGVHDRSPRAILFIETGVMPLKYRRIVLALRSIHKLLTNIKSEYALRALRDSIRLWEEGKPCYIGDIHVLANLPLPVSFRPSHISNPDSIPNLIQESTLSPAAYEGQPTSMKSMCLPTEKHSPFYAHLAISWQSNVFAGGKEDKNQYLGTIACAKAEIRSAREEFFLTATERVPTVPDDFARLTHVDFLRSVLKTRVLEFPLGRLAHRIFTFYDRYPPYLLPQYRDA
ncbi:unnamed protein product [Cyclocybe aegerita]|uniref:Lysine-specific metallo-endopeptidase domain-containing protein n=1 Tax=Cyclocybe aegerita TaxID=1973307 RepID=A0A8S0X1H8_CYCAE|nr:unnamed protein product [Cyclocybe aegerita]